MEQIQTWLQKIGLSEAVSNMIIHAGIAVILILLMILFDLITKRVLLRGIEKIVKKTKTTWDDSVFKSGVLSRLSHIVPAIVLYSGIVLVFPDNAFIIGLIQKGCMAYIILLTAVIINDITKVVDEIYRSYPISKRRPIKGYLQLISIVIFALAIILVLSILLEKSAVGILSGIGALTAVLMLVFKDSILGLVASVQLSANNMVQLGDWIEMPKYGADGDVVDITLQTIKVQNWDKTLTTIPIYALISDSFKNWRGMTEAGGRRIKRSIYIDIQSVRFVDKEMLDDFREIELLTDYIAEKEEELRRHNSGKNPRLFSNLRELTNVGTFRAYLENYLRRESDFHNNMTMLVRQLPATEKGLPIEVYAFTIQTEWAEYEQIQADLFDHLYAILPEFGLRAFQKPSGYDLHGIMSGTHQKKES